MSTVWVSDPTPPQPTRQGAGRKSLILRAGLSPTDHELRDERRNPLILNEFT
jgi:hypothetical protein